MLTVMVIIALMIIVVVMMAPAHGARGCLDRVQASRTWPTKQLAIDDDGCFTYMRRGLKPAPEAVLPPVIVTAPAEDVETITKLDLLQRWPDVIHHDPKPRVVEVEPMMTPRTVVSVIMVVALFCAVFEVAFGGLIVRKWLKSGRN